MRKPYPTDLSDEEWKYIEPHVPGPKGHHGRPRIHSLREILNAIFFYVLRSGCQWRMLPHDFPTAVCVSSGPEQEWLRERLLEGPQT
jgi:putative transposase